MESDGNGFPLIPALPGIPDSREALRSAFAYDRAGMRSIFVVTMLALLFACGGEDREQQEAAAIAKAEAAAKELATQLGAKLKHALGEGGPAEAIKVCSESAQQMSTEIGEKHGVSLRRTALRVRNPNNAPDEWERKTLQELEPLFNDPQSNLSTDALILREEREIRVLKPIRMQALCGMCHGSRERLDPVVVDTLRATYPTDEAVDFKPGDLRGAISVRVPLE